MQVANTRVSLILALKNDKNSERWEEFVNQYYAYLHYAAFSRDETTGRYRFVPDGISPEDEQRRWNMKSAKKGMFNKGWANSRLLSGVVHDTMLA